MQVKPLLKRIAVSINAIGNPYSQSQCYFMILAEQIKAARAILNLSQKQLAGKAGLAVATLNNIERGAQTDPKISTLKAIRRALEAEGIEFINEPMKGVGLCLRQKRAMPDDAVVLIVDDNKADRTLYLFKDRLDGHVIKRAIQYAVQRKHFEGLLIARAN